MLVGMVLSGFIGVVARMGHMTVSRMSMMRAFLVAFAFMMLCGFSMVAGGMVVMFSRLRMMLGTCMLRHVFLRVKRRDACRNELIFS